MYKRQVLDSSESSSILVVGGRNPYQSALEVVERLEVSSSSLRSQPQPIPPLSCPRCAPCAVTVDSRVYVMGGYNGESWERSGEVWSSTEATWTSIPSMEEVVEYPTAVVLDDQRFILVKGMIKNTIAWQLFHIPTQRWRMVRNPLLQSMTPCSPLNLPDSQFQVIGSRLIVVGGRESPESSSSKRCVQIPLQGSDLWNQLRRSEGTVTIPRDAPPPNDTTTLYSQSEAATSMPQAASLQPQHPVSPKESTDGPRRPGIAVIAAGMADLSPLRSPSMSRHSTARLMQYQQQQSQSTKNMMAALAPPLEEGNATLLSSPSTQHKQPAGGTASGAEESSAHNTCLLYTSPSPRD